MYCIYEAVLNKLHRDSKQRYRVLRDNYKLQHPSHSGGFAESEIQSYYRVKESEASHSRNPKKLLPVSSDQSKANLRQFKLVTGQGQGFTQNYSQSTRKENISHKNRTIQTNHEPRDKSSQSKDKKTINEEISIKLRLPTINKELNRWPGTQNNSINLVQRTIKSTQILDPPTTIQLSQEPQQSNVLFECTEGCGRSFNAKALQKHVKVCKKVFQQKRKEFSASQKREVEGQKEVVTVQSKNSKKQNTAKDSQKALKWKQQSLALRAAMKRNKGQPLTEEEEEALRAPDDSLTQCGGCGRRFNAKAAEKHIPACVKRNNKK